MERTRTSAKCLKRKNARAKRAKLLFFIVKYANLWRSCCRRRRGCLRPVYTGDFCRSNSMQFLSQQNRIRFQTCPKPLRYRGDKSHLVYTCNFSATKIASSCCDKNRLCKRAFKLPIYFGEQIRIRCFSFWVVSLKWGSKWLQIATPTERRLKIQVSSTAVVKLLFWTYSTVRERISTLSSDL